MEVVNVERKSVDALVFVAVFHLVNVFKKEFAVKKAGKGIFFRRLDYALVFVKRDDSLAARQNHFGHVKGLCDEVCRSKLYALYFGGLF